MKRLILMSAVLASSLAMAQQFGIKGGMNLPLFPIRVTMTPSEKWDSMREFI